MIVSLEDVSYKYDEKPILTDVNFTVCEQEKWGVVGMNGAGKSTLLKLIEGFVQPDTGHIIRKKDCKIAYCPQESVFEPGYSVFETVQRAVGRDVEKFRIESILNKLGFTDYGVLVDALSGGQLKRVALSIALLQKADLYLLDEPTNHLDQEMIVWLEKFLQKVTGAVVLVTHDRYFLTRVTNHIVEVDQCSLFPCEGNYADYLEQREQRYEQARIAEHKRQSFLRTEIEWIRAGAQARSTKQKGRIQRFEKIAAMEAPKQRSGLSLSVSSTRLGGITIDLDHVSKAFDGKTLFSDFSYSVQRMDRAGIIGPNGCGKSTLIKIMAGKLKPDTGEVRIGETVKIGYFAQHNEVFRENQRVIDYLQEYGKVIETVDHEKITASQMLERFLFPRDEQYKPIAKCSGGEKRRLYLCSILMTAPNILLLDEPTNDLDTDTMAVLEDYLEAFPGAVLAVSHDRYFLDKIADRLFCFENGRILLSNLSYSDYLEQKTEPKKPVEKKEVKKEKAKLSYLEKKELQSLEKEMPLLSEKIKAAENTLGTVTDYAEIASVGAELENLRKQMETMENRWLELEEKAE